MRVGCVGRPSVIGYWLLVIGQKTGLGKAGQFSSERGVSVKPCLLLFEVRCKARPSVCFYSSVQFA